MRLTLNARLPQNMSFCRIGSENCRQLPLVAVLYGNDPLAVEVGQVMVVGSDAIRFGVFATVTKPAGCG